MICTDDNGKESRFATVDVSVEMAQEIKEIIDRASTGKKSSNLLHVDSSC